MIISKDSEKKDKACVLLIRRASEIGHAPLKSDFSAGELVFIKAHLGPWPRALETAGLKERHNDTQSKTRGHRKNKKGTEEKKTTQKEITER